MAALEVPGVSKANIRPLEISDKDPLEVRSVVDAVVWEELKPCPNMFPHANGKILNDKIVIIHSSGPTGEPDVFEPNAWVCLPDVLGDVGGWSETPWERCSPDTPAEGPWSQALRAGAPVVWPASVPRARFTAPLDGSAGIHVAGRCTVDIIIVSGPMLVADDATSVLVWIGPLVYRWLARSRRQVGPWRDRRTPSRA